MNIEEFQAVMAEISQANADHGVDVRGGKKYLEVAKRVEIFRKHFGTDAGICTEIKHLGIAQGEPVVIQAVIEQGGFVVATGTACEIIGAGNVNKASALENAETSAIGRALATLGLHGGEFASLNEMQAIGKKPENFSAEAIGDAWEDAIMDSLPDYPSESAVAEAYADQMKTDVDGYKSAKGIEGYMARHKKHLDFMSQHAPEAYSALRSHAWGRMQELDKGKAA